MIHLRSNLKTLRAKNTWPMKNIVWLSITWEMGIHTKLNFVKEVNHQLIRKEKAGLGLRQSFFWSESEANFFLVWVWCKVFFWFGLRQRFFWSDTREVPVQLKLLRWAVSKKERRNNEQGAVPVLTLSSTSWPYNWLTHSLNWETAWLPTLASSLAPKIFSLLFKHLSLFKSSQVATYLSSSCLSCTSWSKLEGFSRKVQSINQAAGPGPSWSGVKQDSTGHNQPPQN